MQGLAETTSRDGDSGVEKDFFNPSSSVVVVKVQLVRGVSSFIGEENSL